MGTDLNIEAGMRVGNTYMDNCVLLREAYVAQFQIAKEFFEFSGVPMEDEDIFTKLTSERKVLPVVREGGPVKISYPEFIASKASLDWDSIGGVSGWPLFKAVVCRSEVTWTACR